MYSKIAEEEDNKVAERWQKDADGLLIFVSPHVIFCSTPRINKNLIDRFILCRHCCVSRIVNPGPHPELSGYHHLLSPEHLSTSSSCCL